jgi:hypothetical protein
MPTYRVLPCVQDGGDVSRPNPGQAPQFWGVYKTDDGKDDLEMHVADFNTETEADEYAEFLRGRKAVSPDPAAVLGIALSLYNGIQKEDDGNNLSDAYSGGDEFMRQCMRVATLFETWACDHVDFGELDDVWPYLLEDKFHEAYRKHFGPTELARITEAGCLLIAQALELTTKKIP